jgi:hypothetical protein
VLASPDGSLSPPQVARSAVPSGFCHKDLHDSSLRVGGRATRCFSLSARGRFDGCNTSYPPRPLLLLLLRLRLRFQAILIFYSFVLICWQISSTSLLRPQYGLSIRFQEPTFRCVLWQTTPGLFVSCSCVYVWTCVCCARVFLPQSNKHHAQWFAKRGSRLCVCCPLHTRSVDCAHQRCAGTTWIACCVVLRLLKCMYVLVHCGMRALNKIALQLTSPPGTRYLVVGSPLSSDDSQSDLHTPTWRSRCWGDVWSEQ